MYKKILILILITIVLFTIIACSTGLEENTSLVEDGDIHISKAGDDIDLEDPGDLDLALEEEKDPIKEKLDSMTLDEKIGQLLIVGLDGYHMDDHITSLIEDHHIGGVIFFSRNIKDPQQLTGLINSLKEKNRGKLPLFISIDQEGGRVSRMPKDILNTPSNREIGKKNNPDYAFEIASTTGEVLRSFGFNMNFAPVLDIDSNPNNSVIGDRSFGANHKIVEVLGGQTIEALRSKGIIPVVKHFPGHGDTSMDSHLNLPIVNKDWGSLLEFEIQPFIKAIEKQIDVVMVAHILFKQIDPDNPASLSKTIISNLLRKDLNFNGLVITDDMTMGAITENYGIAQAAVQSILAGTDLVLLSHGHENKLETIKALKEALVNNEISLERLDESVYRILELKEKYQLM